MLLCICILSEMSQILHKLMELRCFIKVEGKATNVTFMKYCKLDVKFSTLSFGNSERKSNLSLKLSIKHQVLSSWCGKCKCAGRRVVSSDTALEMVWNDFFGEMVLVSIESLFPFLGLFLFGGRGLASALLQLGRFLVDLACLGLALRVLSVSSFFNEGNFIQHLLRKFRLCLYGEK